ncbi:MAG: class I SAM-dependent methyltransferase [Candidatus Micrarchaeota archaeon]|nr:class I SAM-dependent methyltransferase [Candidatus Micrarchaeota archaeon]MDE1847458.1 class I SAM-dependent methyltransferase [Candidatus Micrarchaeota archaeon]MDE1864047.1 class I SAM-dependent methyltransferase [Candidatus Micrarchaeota archaeon]
MMKVGAKSTQELQTASSKIQQKEKAGEKLISVLSISGKMSVLDIGSGDGTLTLKLAKRTSGQVIRIDNSLDNLLPVKKQAEQEGITNITFLEMDARTMKFENKFDAIFSDSRLHLINGHDHVLGKIKDALKPGGILGLQIPLVTRATAFIDPIEKVTKSADMLGYYTNWTPQWLLPGPEGYDPLLKQTGVQAKSRIISEPIALSTLEESLHFFNYNLNILKDYTRLLPPDDIPKLESRIRKNVEEQLKSGEISFQMDRLFVLSNPEKFDLLAESIQRK